LIEKIEKENDPLIGSPTIDTKYSQVFQSMSYDEIAVAARAAAYSEFAIAPPVYSEIAVAAPPVYAEEKHDDLAAELAQMKAMMEQMRLEKERMEMEAKRKAEEEAVSARIRAEQEEALELAEIHKKLNVALQTYHTSYGIHKNAIGAADQKALEQMKASGEIILYIVTGSLSSGEGTLNTIDIIITNRNVYSLRFHRDSTRAQTGSGLCYTSGLRCSALYTFDKPLNAKQTKMLSILYDSNPYYNAVMSPNRMHYSIMSTMHSIINNDYANNPALGNVVYIDARKKFETIIRLIPGSYKNGSWRQLDGFFGMYFNETTMEVSEVPPL
jgi:hypothetical protein